MEEKKRIEWIDVAKGILIILIILGHAIRDDMRQSNPFLDYVYFVIHMFNMSCFFMLSGYVFSKFSKNNGKINNIIKKFKKLIIPWAIYSVFIYIVFLIVSKISNINLLLTNAGYNLISFHDYFKLSVEANNPYAYHLWYIEVLFFVYLIVILFNALKNKKNKMITIIFSLILIVIIRFSKSDGILHLLNCIVLYLPFFIIGSSLDKMSFKKNVKSIFIVAISIIYCILRVFVFSGDSGNSIVSNNIYISLIMLLLSYIFIPIIFVMFYNLCKNICKKCNRRITNILSNIGNNSYIIYLLHQPFCAFLSIILFNKLHFNSFVSIFICTILSLLLPILLKKVFINIANINNHKLKNNKIKIAIIGHKRIPSNEGGIEKGVEQHAIRMVQRGYDVTVYNRGGHNVFGKENDIKKVKKYKGIKIVTIPTTSGKACVPIYSFLATLHCIFHKIDVISYRASGSCVMIPIAKLFGIRCIASLHGIDSQRDKWGGFASKYLRFGEKMAATKADVCLVLSRNMKNYIKETYNKDSVLFVNGIDKPNIKSANIIKKKYGLEKDSYILSLGRIVPEKGLHYLIEAFKKCKTDKELIIAGGSEANSDYYNHLVTLANGDNRIKFIGFVQGTIIEELYSNAYVFILPSNLEGMANALLEAMSYENCCLVSDIPENTEVVLDNAIVFKKGNTEDLQKKLQYILDNKNEVKKYKKTSSKFILERYNWDKVVTQMLEIYNGNVIEYSEVK